MSRGSRQTDPRFLAKSQLIKDRGWTAAMVTEFLGEPDDKRVNPHCRTAAPMCLYWVERVVRVEDIPAVAAWRKAILARRETAAQVVA